MSTSSYDAEEAKHFIQEVVAYLHSNSIRHKDLKPANVLLYPDGLRLTDFGTATDFTDFSQSATEGGDRGTPKYFSPETSAFELCGRASDIFSLGCIFLEVLAVANGYSLEQLKQSRPDKDRSFQANIEQVRNWIRAAKFKDWDILLLNEIGLMLHAVPGSRPTIEDIQHRLEYVEILSGTSPHSTYLANCCKLNHYNCQEDRPSIATAITFDLRIGNVLVRPSWHLTIMAEDGDFIHRLKSMPVQQDVGVGYTVARSPFKAHASVFSKSSQQASVLELELLSSSTPTRETLYSGYDLPPPEDLITLGTTFGKPENEHDSSSSLRRGKRVTKVDQILPSKEQKHAVQQFLDQLRECNHNAHFDVLWITMDNQETPQRLALVVTQALSSKLEGSTESDYSP
ncbi:hypothetical protein BLS_006556 [Venturia inaequalis]|uniref:Protein kinase domain-containing protein n=1 Tax=Venturia inaequalis TaxID=5025 RepID=A0A8H3V9H5_VENIN|nr:hypothetical protein BLS_006556 [Venturia inaequalis]KAE9985712.1 hypothetical protein EG327_004600 [Venturia inaequalis]